MSHSQLQLNPRACFAFSFLHLGKWQVHPLSCSNTKHDSWFPFLLLTHPTGNPSEDSVGCIFKIHPGSDHFLPRLSIYRSRPPWFIASHQCNCLLIAFLPLQSRKNIFFSSWVISWLAKLTLYQVLYTVIYIHHLLSKCMPPKNLLCTRCYTQWFISITYSQNVCLQSVQSAFSRLRQWNEIPYPGSHSSLKDLEVPGSSPTSSPRLFPSIQLLMNNLIFTPRKSLSQSCLMKSMQPKVKCVQRDLNKIRSVIMKEK